jgi:hypothetical protein
MLEVHNVDPRQEAAARYDYGKSNWHLLPYCALQDVVDVFDYGATKYSERNWEKGMSWSRMFNSMMRHLVAWWNGEDTDKESGLPHLAHAAFGCLGLLFFGHKRLGTDDRPGGTSNDRTSEDSCM